MEFLFLWRSASRAFNVKQHGAGGLVRTRVRRVGGRCPGGTARLGRELLPELGAHQGRRCDQRVRLRVQQVRQCRLLVQQPMGEVQSSFLLVSLFMFSSSCDFVVSFVLLRGEVCHML